MQVFCKLRRNPTELNAFNSRLQQCNGLLFDFPFKILRVSICTNAIYGNSFTLIIMWVKLKTQQFIIVFKTIFGTKTKTYSFNCNSQ